MIELLLPIFAAAGSPVGHVTDHPLIGWYISNVTVLLALATILTMLLIIPAARRIATGPARNSIDDYRAQGLLANFVEAVCLYLREEVFRPILHDQTDKYIPVLWTFFWFILICNLLGLVPLIDLTMAGYVAMGGDPRGWHGFGGTATQSIWVTGALALVAFIIINVTGLMKDPIGYFKHLTGGAPWFMWPIIIPVEAAGIFIRPIALALRLFANMTGGHVMLAVLFSFVWSLSNALGTVGHGLALIPLLGATAIYMLEVLVAFIQAFIFTFLTGLFLGQVLPHDHAHDHHPEEYEQKPGLEHGPLL